MWSLAYYECVSHMVLWQDFTYLPLFEIETEIANLLLYAGLKF
jgi:hypothetical protein